MKIKTVLVSRHLLSSFLLQESSSSGKDVPKRAYSPHRYSNHRSPRHVNGMQVAEKDLSS